MNEEDYWVVLQSYPFLGNAEAELIHLNSEGLEAKIDYTNDALGGLYSDNILLKVRQRDLEKARILIQPSQH